MEINFNLGSLKIVHPSLMEYLKKIQQNVSNNISTIRDEKKVATDYEAIELLNKTQGTLKMIGLVGLVKVLNLCNESLKSVKEIKFDTAKNIKILEACENILKNVAIYLDLLLSGEMDNAIRFFVDYEILANLLDKEVSIKDLFTPKLDLIEEGNLELQSELKSKVLITQLDKDNIIKTINNAKEVLERNNFKIKDLISKNNIFTDHEDKTIYHDYIKEIYSAIHEVQNLKLSKNIYILLGLQKLFICLTSPIFNDDIESILSFGIKNIENNFIAIENNLKSIENSIQTMELGDKTTHLKVDEETIKEVLFFIIKALDINKKLEEMPIYKEVNSYIDINFHAQQLNNSTIVSTVFQKYPEITIQIDKNFLDIKEELILMTSKQMNSEEFIIQHSIKFITYIQKLSELLISTNTKELSGILNALNAIFTKIKNKDLKFSEILQKEVSVGVVLVEYGINTFIKSVVKDTDRINFSGQVNLQQKRLLLAATNKIEDLSKLALPSLDEKSKKNDERKAFLKIFQELNKEFVKVENTLDQFLKNQEEDIDEIKTVFKPLKSARGIFSVIGKPELSEIISEIIKVWEQIVELGIDSIDQELLKNSFTWVSAISLIINASKNDNDIEANEIVSQIIPKFKEYMDRKEKLNNPIINISTGIKTKLESMETIINKESILTYDSPIEFVYNNIEKIQIFKDEPNDKELAEVYATEAEEVIYNIKQSIKELTQDPTNNEEILNLRRFFHTLKGSGKMVGLKYLGEAGWIVEQTLNKVLSEELELNTDLINIIEYAQIKFEDWIKDLKENNCIKLDLIEFKEAFINYNPQLSLNVNSSIIIENGSEESKIIEIPEEVILVGDKTISLVLYNMFVEESANHIKAMNIFIHDQDNIENGIISSEFMLHAHTLASIARTVNLLDCAQIAGKIELVSNFALDKNVNLSSTEMKVLCHAVESLEQFRLIANGVQIDPEYVNQLIQKLSIIQDSISNNNNIELEENKLESSILIEESKKTEVIDNESEEPRKKVENFELSNINLDELVEKISEKLTSTLKYPEPTENIGSENLVELLTSKFNKAIESGIERVNQSLNNILDEKIEKFQQDLNKLLEINIIKIEKMNEELDLSISENTIKIKKYNEQFNTLLDSNIEKIEKINTNITDFIVNKTEEINNSLTIFINEKSQFINEKLENTMTDNLERLEIVVGESLEDVSEHLNKKVDESLLGIINILTKLETEGINSNSSVDISEVSEKIEGQFSDFAKVLVENKYNTKEVVDELFNKIDNIEFNMRQVIDEQKSIQQKNQELIKNLQNNIKEEVSVTKKGGLLGIFGK